MAIIRPSGEKATDFTRYLCADLFQISSFVSTGSSLGIDESRALVANQNATTVQVAAGVLGAVQYAIAKPDRGVLLADDLPHRFVLKHAMPYLGSFTSRPVRWTPFSRGSGLPADGPNAQPSHRYDWQFASFLSTRDPGTDMKT
ncbi:hypothetical protein OG326_06160 [Nocardia sp. NBC_01327]|nr:hypothetical protein OG326_06160 [Nocardia sp. NBC_01327]